jgi:2-polyprenyl-3-methyl-5-hydroxy-6-metoxy-1,4-benzoquinol methylase
MSPVSLTILIPVFDQARTIHEQLTRIVSAAYFSTENIEVHLIVVDTGSQDGSRSEIERFALGHQEVRLLLLKQEASCGRGWVVRMALGHARSDLFLIQDGYLEFDRLHLVQVLSPLLSDAADVVVGTASGDIKQRRVLAFRTPLALTVPLVSKGLELDQELTLQFAKRHARFVEVPVTQGTFRSPNLLLKLWTEFRTRYLSAAHTDAGADMLVAMSTARRFNRWMAETISPFIVGDVLELGAGMGNLTVLLAEGRPSYTATDTDAQHLSELHSRTTELTNLKIRVCDFSKAEDIAPLLRSADTVICLNVLEHVPDDVAGLRNIRQCLRPGGTAIVLVPQGKNAFGSLDEVLEHKRRYSEKELQEKMQAAGFEVTRMIHFNRATWPGWYLNSRILRKRRLSLFQLRLFDLGVPLWRRVDNRLPWPPTSIMAIGRVTGQLRNDAR